MIPEGACATSLAPATLPPSLLRPWLPRVAARAPNLYPSYGLYQATVTAADTLVLLFAVRLLDTSAGELGFLDSASTLGYTLAAVALGFSARRLAASRPVLVLGFLLTALTIVLFSAAGALWIAVVLALLFGAFTVVPNSTVPWYLCSRVHRSQWAQIYGRLSAASALGGAAGLLFAFGWLTAARVWTGEVAGERSLFLLLGVATAVAAGGVWYARGSPPGPSRRTPRKAAGSDTPSLLRPAAAATTEPRLPLPSARPASSVRTFHDSWLVHYLLTGLLQVGVGMSFTGALLYLMTAVHAPGAAVLAIVLGFRLASWLSSTPAGRLVGRFTPLRLQQAAGAWRFLAVSALGLVALLPPGPWSVVLVGLLLFLCGASSGVLGVTGLAAATWAIPSHSQGAAIFFFNGVANGGVGLGAVAAALLAPAYGFPLLMAFSSLTIGCALWLWHRY
ncbi:MAG: MFS transporter [Chloroflexi bacterium]|nr:MFS transporter [Chloroflexota bacterium]